MTSYSIPTTGCDTGSGSATAFSESGLLRSTRVGGSAFEMKSRKTAKEDLTLARNRFRA